MAAQIARCCRAAGPWLAAAVLMLVASHLRRPLLLSLREMEFPLLLGLGSVVWLVAAKVRHTRLLRGLVVVAMVLASGNEAWFRMQRAEVLAADGGARSLGAHFMVGYRSLDEVAVLAQRGLIGGIYLSRCNVAGRSAGRIRAEIAALQAGRERNGLPPLIVAADQEGGPVAHLSPPLASLLDDDRGGDIEARAEAYGRAQGRELSLLGVSLNLGPVVDLRPLVEAGMLDFHTRIGERAIAADPALVTRVARGYARGLAGQGVTPTLKHFPGLGRVRGDTHHFSASLTTSAAELQSSDWRPFRSLARGDTAMMLAHVVLPALDPARPVSLSHRVVQDLLRRQWGFRGLLISDDLNMGAVYRRGPCAAAVEGLQAGVDMLLISYDPDQYYRGMHCAMRALARGKLDAGQLRESAARVRRTALRRPCAQASGVLALLPQHIATASGAVERPAEHE